MCEAHVDSHLRVGEIVGEGVAGTALDPGSPARRNFDHGHSQPEWLEDRLQQERMSKLSPPQILDY
jgi:hypothetical protein